VAICNALLVVILLPITVAIGAYYQLPLIPYLPILAIVTVTILVAMGKLKYIPLYIFAISLSLLWQTSMLGISVVGSDITSEYNLSVVIMEDGWDWTYLYWTHSGSSIVIGLLAPWLGNLMDLAMVYKLVFPFIFAFVPVILFYAFKKMFGETRAFFATLFFMIVPVFNLEIVAIAKSMVGEFFLALMILTMVSDWRTRWKIPAMFVFLCLATLCHYTVGVLAIGLLVGCLIVRIVTSRMKWSLFSNRKVPLLAMTIVVVLSAGLWYGYYSKANGGYVMSIITRVGGAYALKAETLVQETIEELGKTEEAVELVEPLKIVEPTEPEEPTGVIEPTEPEEPTETHYMQRQSVFIKAAIGLDFFEVSTAGKVFRVIQFITQSMIVLGCFWLLFKHRRYKFTAEFIGCIVASFVLLLCCIFIFRLSALINMTRFYHTSLFFIAPMFVLGVDALGSGLTNVVKMATRKKKE